MGYSVSMMADYQNGVISRSLIFSVFWSGLLRKTTLNDLENRCCYVFWNLNL